MLSTREYARIEPPFPNPACAASGAPALALPLAACALALCGLLFVSPARAIEFGQGEVRGSLDTTISHGITWRVGAREEERVRSFLSANSNDGNLNHGRGIVSNTSKFTSDLDLGYRNFGAFVRATGHLDFKNEDGLGDRRIPLHPDARDIVGKELDLLDAYVSGAFEVGDTALDVRVGRHVLNWGESTFIQNGVNAFGLVDVGKLRLPGSELREALVPISMASFSVAPTYNLSVEGFYQFDWEETVIDPVGSFFSTTDYVGPGADKAVIVDPRLAALLGPFGSDLDHRFTFGPLTPAINQDLANNMVVLDPRVGPVPLPLDPVPEVDSDFLSVIRGEDRTPKDSGQWGLALRYLAEDLNETEFGFYVANYHSRLPVLGARTSPAAAIQQGLLAANAMVTGGSTVAALTHVATEAVSQRVSALVQAGAIDPAAAPALIEEQVSAAVSEQIQGLAFALALDRYGGASDQDGNRGYFYHEYPENVGLLGMSFNTALGTSGWALQGDYALHLDAPLQRAERELFREGLFPMTHSLELALRANGLGSLAEEHAARAAALAASDPLGAAAAAEAAQAYAEQAQQARGALDAYLAGYAPGNVRSYIRHEVSQIQATATKVFGPVLGADALAFVTEAALMHVHNMTEEPLEGPARASTLGSDEDADADATSWGYRMAARLDYNNAIGGWNLFPYVQWRHDVNGNSPAPSGPFSQGLTALTLGVSADYLSRWQADIGYTRFGGRRNTLRDRDFVTASISYSF